LEALAGVGGGGDIAQVFGGQNTANQANPPNPPNPVDQANEVLYLYRDPAYAPSYRIRGPYRARRVGLIPQQGAFNVVMSKYRIIVEWGFVNVLNQFSSGEWKRMQKVGLSLVSVNYVISVLLWNCQTCL